ncbi:MAG: transaldolase [Candidatus Pacebacteria bacterium]|nr:transaldolase [Candidatus Paceibacterota bacterium]
MKRPDNLTTKIFLDGGDPNETREIIALLGFLDGQTTNPSLVAKNPLFQECSNGDTACTDDDLWRAYKEIVTEISPLVPESVSIEVYADKDTKAESMIEKGLELNTWIPNAHIKLPITTEGLKAASALTEQGLKVNMTLCFTQDQAAAVYAATKTANPGDVYLSPFVGRLDDRNEDGMSYVKNVVKMFKDSDHHVSPLVASVRSLEHFMYSLSLGADIVTAPGSILREWAEAGMPVPDSSYEYDAGELVAFDYQEKNLEEDWQNFDLSHELTDKGIERFAADWNNLLK